MDAERCFKVRIMGGHWKWSKKSLDKLLAKQLSTSLF
jgi:hypothetical protein